LGLEEEFVLDDERAVLEVNVGEENPRRVDAAAEVGDLEGLVVVGPLPLADPALDAVNEDVLAVERLGVALQELRDDEVRLRRDQLALDLALVDVCVAPAVLLGKLLVGLFVPRRVFGGGNAEVRPGVLRALDVLRDELVIHRLGRRRDEDEERVLAILERRNERVVDDLDRLLDLAHLVDDRDIGRAAANASAAVLVDPVEDELREVELLAPLGDLVLLHPARIEEEEGRLAPARRRNERIGAVHDELAPLLIEDVLRLRARRSEELRDSLRPLEALLENEDQRQEGLPEPSVKIQNVGRGHGDTTRPRLLDRVVKIALRTLLREVAEVPLKPELLLLIAGARVVAARLRRPLVHDDRAHLLLSRPPAWPPCSLLLLGHFALSATFFFATWSTAFFAPKRPTPAAMTAPAI